MIAIILCVLLLILIYIKTIKPHSYWNKKGVKQGNPTYILGDVGGVILKKESFFDAIIKVYNSFPNDRYAGIYTGFKPILLARDLDLIKQIGIKDFEHFLNHSELIPDGVDPLWSKNLFALKGAEWRSMRTTLSPSFTSSKMKIIFNLISECAEQYSQYFLKTKDSQTVELKDLFTRYTNDIIATVAFGIKCDSMKEKNNEFYVMGKKATTFTFLRNLIFVAYTMFPALSKAIGIRFFPKFVGDFFGKIVLDTIRFREENGIVRPDMIHLLLEARKGRKINEEQFTSDAGFATVDEMLEEAQEKKHSITDQDITAQAVIFFFAGFDTVSTLLCFMGYELALNPDIQERLQHEIDDTAKNCNGKVTYEALVKMKYMDMVVTETLRKWPPQIATDRVCTKSYTIQPITPEEKPITLKTGDVVWLPTGAIHRDPKYYPNPEKFDPERFNDENKHKVNPYAFMPFGVGPRNCIGSRMALLEVKTIFFYILQKFDFVATAKTEIPLTLNKSFMNLAAENGMWLDLRPRKS